MAIKSMVMGDAGVTGDGSRHGGGGSISDGGKRRESLHRFFLAGAQGEKATKFRLQKW